MELLSILFQLWVCAKALKPKINCPLAKEQQEVLEMWTGQRNSASTWPQTLLEMSPVSSALLTCHSPSAMAFLYSSHAPFIIFPSLQTAPYLSGDSHWPPGGTMDWGEKIWLPGQTLTVIYCLLSKMLNFFGLQVLSKIRLDMIYINVLLALMFHDRSMHTL